MASKILIGTASWSDPEFVRDWYPKGLRASERLAHYARHFQMVELNSSFYAFPDPATAKQWAHSTPAGFIFDVKLHRFFSRHSCELKMLPQDLRRAARTTDRGRVILDPEIEAAALDEFLKGIAPLETAGKLGALLLQLSPAFSPRASDLDELAPLLEQLAPRPVVVELRNRGWVTGPQLPKTTQFLQRHRAGFVSVDAPASDHFSVMPPVDVISNPAVGYLRLHGRNEHAYLTGKTVPDRFNYDYSEAELEEVKDRIAKIGEGVEVVHVVFNNNRSDYAPQAALRFRRVMGQALPAEGPKPTGHQQRSLGL